MFDALHALFRNPKDYKTPLPPTDAKHALGALLVRAAKADSVYLVEEIETVDQILALRNGLNPLEATQMRAACEKLERAMPATEALAAILKVAISEEEREATLRALWTVVFADGIKKAEEEQVLSQIEEVLGVSRDRALVLQWQET